MNFLYFLSLTLTLLGATAYDPSLLSTCLSNCPPGCSTCTGSTCTSCSPGYISAPPSCAPLPCQIPACSLCNQQGVCLLCSDPYSHFTPSTNTCQPGCPIQNCQKCKQNSLKCQLCSEGFWLYGWDGSCRPTPIQKCLEGHDWRGSEYRCVRCLEGYRPTTDQMECMATQCSSIQNCQRCTNNSYCQLCREGYTNAIQGCTATSCSIGNCLVCAGSEQCQRCASGYQLQNNQCVSIPCSLQNCQKCKPNSLFCDLCSANYVYNIWTRACELVQTSPAPVNCQSMARAGRFYTCLNCLQGFTFTNQNRVACTRQCPPNCLNCQSSTTCSSCQPGFTLSSNHCQKNICAVQDCNLCSPSDICLQCTSQYAIFNQTSKKCVETCQLSHCRRCRAGSSICQQCHQGYSLSLWNGQCIPAMIDNCLVVHDWQQQEYQCSRCEVGLLPSPDQTECRAPICPGVQNCLRCSNISLCDVCRQGYTNTKGLCVKNQCSIKYCMACNQQGLCIKTMSSHYLVSSQPTPKKCQLSNCLICKPGSFFCDCCLPGYQLDPWSNTCSALSQQPAGTVQSSSSLKYLWLLLLVAGGVALVMVIKMTRNRQQLQKQAELQKVNQKKKNLPEVRNPPVLYVIKNRSFVQNGSEGSSEDHPEVKVTRFIQAKPSPGLEPSQIEVEVAVEQEHEPGPFSPVGTNDRIFPQESLRSDLSNELSQVSIKVPSFSVRGKKKRQSGRQQPFRQ